MKRTKFLLWVFIVLTSVTPNFAAEDQFDDFKKRVVKNQVEAFAKDVGGIIGGGSFHTGRSLGFPGVDVGVHMAVQNKPDAENKILKALSDKAFGLPMVQGEVGLPFNIDVIMRGIMHEEVALVGGGLRYGVFKFKLLPLTPGIAASVLGHVLNHNLFSISHQSANVTVDLSVPIISPYVGFGMDRTRIKIKDADQALKNADPTLVGYEATATGTRVTAGLNIKPLPLVYLHGAATQFNGNTGFEGGLGVKF